MTSAESYNEGLDPLKSFVRWERELPQLIRKLRNEHVHYAQTMRQLLEPITTEFELAEMLSEPGGQLWKEKAVVSKLEGKLQESYHAYQSTIVDIERIMKKIASKLDLDRAAEVGCIPKFHRPLHSCSPKVAHAERPRGDNSSQSKESE